MTGAEHTPTAISKGSGSGSQARRRYVMIIFFLLLTLCGILEPWLPFAKLTGPVFMNAMYAKACFVRQAV